MDVREALEKAIPDMDIEAPVLYEKGQAYVDIPMRLVAEALAPKIEAALRAAYCKGFSDGADDNVVDVVESLLTDPGVTAGIAKLGEEA